MSKLEDLVPPLELCKEAAEKFPEAWRRDFCQDEWHQTALCWRTFNKWRNDEYTIVFFTGSLDYENGDVNAPTLVEIIEVLPMRTDGIGVTRGFNGWSLVSNVASFIEEKSLISAALKLWMKVQNEKMKHEK